MAKRVAEKPWHLFRASSSTEERPLTSVYHIAHLEAAHRIITEGKVRSGLVDDESKLKQERILVTWLSPNIWRYGSRYGSVQFVFDWPTLSKGHRAYWVECITAYRPPACRILFTKNDYDNKPDLLIPYDPKEGDGPWRLDANGNHYWNAKYCLEFMIERDIETAELQDLKFCEHHRHQCSIYPLDCPDRELSFRQAGGRFLARLAASKSKLPPSHLDWKYFADSAIDQIRRIAEEEQLLEVDSGLTLEDAGSSAIARALLNAYATPMLRDDISHLAKLFGSQDALKDCCLTLIRAVVQSK